MERRIQTPSKFLFPNLETLYWYAAKNLSYSLQGKLNILTTKTSLIIKKSKHYTNYYFDFNSTINFKVFPKLFRSSSHWLKLTNSPT